MDDLAAKIAYKFRDRALRDQVFTHRSFRHENPAGPELDNERLEFLGDAVLGFLVSRMLFARFPERREGELSRLRSHLVSADHLAAKARALGLGEELSLGRGEERSGGRDKDSILADAYESLLAGIFLDGGLDPAAGFVEREFHDEIEALVSPPPLRDHKSHLQEVLHTMGLSEPFYRVVEEAGPDHHKMFEVAVEIEGREAARGIGRSKRAAQQEAARAALAGIGDRPAEDVRHAPAVSGNGDSETSA